LKITTVFTAVCMCRYRKEFSRLTRTCRRWPW